MKRLIIIILTMMASSSLFGQTNNDPIYIVFTSTIYKETGVSFVSIDDLKYRVPIRGYFFVDLEKDYLCRFMYYNKKSEPNNPIVTKPLYFLDTIYYIDWDAIHPELTREQAMAIFEEIKSHKKIYFIDRNEIADGNIKIVPVTYSKVTF